MTKVCYQIHGRGDDGTIRVALEFVRRTFGLSAAVRSTFGPNQRIVVDVCNAPNFVRGQRLGLHDEIVELAWTHCHLHTGVGGDWLVNKA